MDDALRPGGGDLGGLEGFVDGLGQGASCADVFAALDPGADHEVDEPAVEAVDEDHWGGLVHDGGMLGDGVE